MLEISPVVARPLLVDLGGVGQNSARPKRLCAASKSAFTGQIQLYRGKAEIVVRDAKQLSEK